MQLRRRPLIARYGTDFHIELRGCNLTADLPRSVLRGFFMPADADQTQEDTDRRY